MVWTVGELRERLDDYGDHVPVVVVLNRGDRDFIHPEFDVSDSARNGEVAVELEVDLS